MSALTSLLIRDQRLSVRRMEEAIQRQVLSGGKMDTVLLELGVLPENIMAAYCAAMHGLLPATRDEVMKVPRDLVRLVPREVAERHRLVPLSSTEGGLVVAVSEPLEARVEAQLGFLLGVTISQRVICEVRMASALRHHFGIDMTPRMLRLTEKLRAQNAGDVPYVAPLEQTKSKTEAPPAPVLTPAEAAGSRPSFAKVDLPSAPASPAASVDAAGVRVGGAQVIGQAAKKNPKGRPKIRVSEPKSEALLKLRGPLTAKRAVDLLSAAASRDEILEVVFAFARQFFDCTALFVVHEQAIEGMDMVGSSLHPDHIQRVSVPLLMRSAFSLVAEGGVPVITQLDDSNTDRNVRHELGRDDAMPAALLPLRIRDRVVLMVYGDRGGEAFGLADIPELVAFAPRVSEAFQKLILQMKVRRASGTDHVQVGPAEESNRNDTVAAPPPDHEADTPAYDSTNKRRVPTLRPTLGEVESPTKVHFPAPPKVPASAPAETLEEHGAGVSERESAERGTPESNRKARPRRSTLAGSEALGVLGVPRSAPPPPAPGALPQLTQGERKTDPDLTPPGSVSNGEEPSLESAKASTAPEPEADTLKSAAPSEPEEAEPNDTLRPMRSVVISSPPPERSSSRPVLEVVPSDDDEVADEPELTVAPLSDEEADELEEEARASEPPKREPSGDAPTVEAVIPATREHANLAEDSDSAPEEDDDDDLDIEIAPLTAEEAAELQRGVFESIPPEVALSEAVLKGVTPSASPRATGQIASSEPPPPTHLPIDPGGPSVIVDMGEDEEALVRELKALKPDDDSESAIDAVVRAGEAALPVLVREFPGPLWFDRNRPHRRLPRGQDVSAISRAIVRFGECAVPYALSLLERDNADERFYATLVASEFSHRKMVAALGRRVFDPDEGTAALAIDILRLLRVHRPEFLGMLEMIRSAARVPRRSASQRARAVAALGELRDAKAIRLCVELLSAKESRLREAAHRALCTITCQDFGTTPRRWEEWERKRGDAHRIEWLIDALLHSDEKLRGRAGDELKQETQEYYGFHPALSRHDREVAQRKYRRWWESEGRDRFTE